ncbi:MAG: helix-turn-helix transcriptional regulator [Planctomycetota bacterium]
MAKTSPKDTVDPTLLRAYEEELLIFFGGEYPEKLLVKGERIVQLREWLGKHLGRNKAISQADLAKRAGLDVDQATIGRYETKHKEAPTLHLWAIARSSGIPLHDIAKTNESLPITTSTSSIHRAKVLIIKGWLTKSLPQDPSIDLKDFVENKWDNAQFNDMISMTKTQRRLLWLVMAQEGWLTTNEQGQFFFNDKLRLPPALTILVRMGHVVSSLFFERVSVTDNAYGTAEEQRNAIIHPLSEALKTLNAALESNDLDLDTCLEGLRDCDLAFSTNDNTATQATQLYHASFSQWLDVVWGLMVAAKDKNHFNVSTMITPLFQAMYDHRLRLCQLLAGDPVHLDQSGGLEMAFRSFVVQYLQQFDDLKAHLAEIGILENKPDDK